MYDYYDNQTKVSLRRKRAAGWTRRWPLSAQSRRTLFMIALSSGGSFFTCGAQRDSLREARWMILRAVFSPPVQPQAAVMSVAQFKFRGGKRILYNLHTQSTKTFSNGTMYRMYQMFFAL